MEIGWKSEVLRKMGIEWITLSRDEWIILLLGLDGRAPIVGEHVFHTVFFLYPFSPFDVKPLFLTPFSPEIFALLRRLGEEGIIEKGAEIVRGEFVDIYSLTDRGLSRYRDITRRGKNRWVLLKGFVAKPFTQVAEELEALKRTYNGRSPKSILKVLLSKARSEDPVLMAQLGERSVEFLRLLIRYGASVL